MVVVGEAAVEEVPRALLQSPPQVAHVGEDATRIEFPAEVQSLLDGQSELPHALAEASLAPGVEGEGHLVAGLAQGEGVLEHQFRRPGVLGGGAEEKDPHRGPSLPMRSVVE